MTKSLEAENAALKRQVESLKRIVEYRAFDLKYVKRQLKFWYEFAAKNYPENPTVQDAALLENQRDIDETSVAEFEKTLGPWLEYKDDFDILTNREINRRVERSKRAVLGNNSFIAAVASWEIAGKPRQPRKPRKVGTFTGRNPTSKTKTKTKQR